MSCENNTVVARLLYIQTGFRSGSTHTKKNSSFLAIVGQTEYSDHRAGVL